MQTSFHRRASLSGTSISGASLSSFAIAMAIATTPALAQPALAQPAQDQDSASDDSYEADTEIIVTGTRIRGTVITDVPPVLELTPEDVASYGASSIEDLIEAISPQTSSGRGRGGGRPIVLLNGQRVSGFRELRNIPPEAITKVEVFPEEVALQYGFRPDQRVINFILSDNFQSFEGELEGGLGTSGGYGQYEIESGYTKIGKDSRLNLNLEYQAATALRESERGIVQTQDADAVRVASDPRDEGEFRTLIPSSEEIDFNGTYSRSLAPGTSLSLNTGYEWQRSRSLLGLNGVTATVPAANPAASFGTDTVVARTTILPDPLTRIRETSNYVGGLTFNTGLGGWNLTLTGSFDQTDTDTLTDQRADFSAFVNGVQSTDPATAIDPLTADLAPFIQPLGTDRSESSVRTIDSLLTLSGSLFELPAGPVTTTASGSYTRRTIDSSDMRNGVLVSTDLGRSEGSVKANVNLPIADRDADVLPFLNTFSVNANVGYTKVSSFGSLVEYGGGFNWEPVDGLSLQASYVGEEAAPGISDLGDAVIVTPNVSVFDLTNNQSVLVDITSGGNPNLVAERRRDIKLGLRYEPDFIEGLDLLVEYFRNRSFDTSNSFPLLTPEIEAAFPDRVTRDGDGTLLAIDRRPVTYDRVASESIRWGVNFSKRFGGDDENESRSGGGERGGGRGGGGERGDRDAATAPTPGAQPARTGGGRDPARFAALREKFCAMPEGEQPDISALPERMQERLRGEDGKIDPARLAQMRERFCSTPPEGAADGKSPARADNGSANPSPESSGGRRGGGRGGLGRGGRGGGRWNVALYHTYRIDETVTIRPGVDPLDLLNGSAIGSNGGAARHEFELEGGWFKNGLGFRVSGNYDSGSRVDGTGLLGSSDLMFGDLATVNFRLFADLGRREDLVKAVPFFKGSRVSLRIDNVFGTIRDVRDGNGDVPLAFQPGFVDPRGRYIELSFRKLF